MPYNNYIRLSGYIAFHYISSYDSYVKGRAAAAQQFQTSCNCRYRSNSRPFSILTRYQRPPSATMAAVPIVNIAAYAHSIPSIADHPADPEFQAWQTPLSFALAGVNVEFRVDLAEVSQPVADAWHALSGVPAGTFTRQQVPQQLFDDIVIFKRHNASMADTTVPNAAAYPLRTFIAGGVLRHHPEYILMRMQDRDALYTAADMQLRIGAFATGKQPWQQTQHASKHEQNISICINAQQQGSYQCPAAGLMRNIQYSNTP